MTLITQADLAKLSRVDRSQVQRAAHKHGWRVAFVSGHRVYWWEDVAEWATVKRHANKKGAGLDKPEATHPQ